MSNPVDGAFSLANPTLANATELPQPRMFVGDLKIYQLKGMNWLVSLFDQGINGILADEMGLGKTVQSICTLAHLAETENIWGPFLVVAPASTLHNWEQEFRKFTPEFKVLPDWGGQKDRQILRKYWNPKQLCMRDANFHVLVTSYQIVSPALRPSYTYYCMRASRLLFISVSHFLKRCWLSFSRCLLPPTSFC